MTGQLETSIEAAARLVVASRYVVALTGSGLSAESGIPTFRGPGGLWTRLGEPPMDGYRRFLADPEAWWRGQLEQQPDPARAEFREAIERARPNPGHYALADLETLGVLQCVITQNVDDLHFKAGARSVLEVHGNRTRLRCIACESRWSRDQFAIQELPPRCPRCGGLVKSDTVMFGEPIPRSVLDRCAMETDRSDCMLAIGTSATVYPAAGFPMTVKARGGAVIEFNPNPTALSASADIVVRGPTGETLPLLAQRVKGLLGLPG